MPLVPRDEIRERLKRLKERMEEAGMDAAFLHYKVDYFYFTGTMQDGVLYVPVDGEPTFFVRRERRRAEREAHITVLPYDLLYQTELKGIKRVGLELDVLPFNEVGKFRKVMGEREVIDLSPIIKELRRRKSAYEIGMIRKAASIANKVYERAKEEIREGMREIELGAILFSYALSLGHEGILRFRALNYEPYSWHILSGKTGSIVGYADSPMGGFGLSPAFPAGASRKRIKKGEPILIDFGICYNGYHVDSTRMFAISSVPDLFLKAYSVTKEIEERVLEALSSGQAGSEAFRLSLKIAEKRGFAAYFLGYGEHKVRFIGHGIGLELSELPFVAANSSYGVEEGEVVAIEPKMVFPRLGACGIEDTVLLGKGSVQVLTDMDSSFVII